MTPEFTQVFETTVEKEHLSEYGWLTGKSDSKHPNIWIVDEEALRAPQQNQVRSKVLTHYSGNEGQRQISQLTNHHSSKKTSLSSTSQKTIRGDEVEVQNGMNRDITHQFRNKENAPWQFCSGVNSSSGIEKGSSSSSTATSSSLEAPTLVRPFSGISTRVNSKGYQWSFINIFKIHQQRLRTQVWQDSNFTSLKLTHPSRAV